MGLRSSKTQIRLCLQNDQNIVTQLWFICHYLILVSHMTFMCGTNVTVYFNKKKNVNVYYEEM